jgi:hypothetical protein
MLEPYSIETKSCGQGCSIVYEFYRGRDDCVSVGQLARENVVQSIMMLAKLASLREKVWGFY